MHISKYLISSNGLIISEAEKHFFIIIPLAFIYPGSTPQPDGIHSYNLKGMPDMASGIGDLDSPDEHHQKKYKTHKQVYENSEY